MFFILNVTILLYLLCFKFLKMNIVHFISQFRLQY